MQFAHAKTLFRNYKQFTKTAFSQIDFLQGCFCYSGSLYCIKGCIYFLPRCLYLLQKCLYYVKRFFYLLQRCLYLLLRCLYFLRCLSMQCLPDAKNVCTRPWLKKFERAINPMNVIRRRRRRKRKDLTVNYKRINRSKTRLQLTKRRLLTA